MKYCSMITAIGPDALQLLDDPDTNCIIIFNEGAPPVLAEIALLHKPAPLLSPLAVNDTVIICNKVFTLTAIGSEAEHTLSQLGHCTLSFKGGMQPERPGCLMLEGEPMTASDIHTGGTIEIF